MFYTNTTRNTLGAFALALAGCGTVPPSMQTPDSGRTTSDAGFSDRPIATDRTVVIDRPSTTDRPDARSDVNNPSSDVSADTSTDSTPPTDASRTITYTINNTFAVVSGSCGGGAPSDLYADTPNNTLYFICSGGPNRVGRLSLTDGRLDTWRIELPNIRSADSTTYPIAYTPINDSFAAITADTGFYIINRTTRTVSDQIPFPAGLKFSGRAFYRNGQLAVPFGNAPQPPSFSDPVMYGAGQVRVYRVNLTTGQVMNRDTPTIITTPESDKNPTAISEIDASTIAVQFSGGPATDSDRQPTLRLIDTSGDTWRLLTGRNRIALTPVGTTTAYTASPSTPLIIAGGQAYIGSANFGTNVSDRVIVANIPGRRVETSISVPRTYTPPVAIYHSGMAFGGALLFVSEFNTNTVSILDPNNPGTMVEIRLTLPGSSVFAAPYVYVTDGSGNIARIQANY